MGRKEFSSTEDIQNVLTLDSMNRGRGKAALYPTVAGSVDPVPDFVVDVRLAIGRLSKIRPAMSRAVELVTQGWTLGEAAKESGVSKRDVHVGMEFLREVLKGYVEKE
jgi:hypothetical protein